MKKPHYRLVIEAGSLLNNPTGVGRVARSLLESYTDLYSKDSIALFGTDNSHKYHYDLPIIPGLTPSNRLNQKLLLLGFPYADVSLRNVTYDFILYPDFFVPRSSTTKPVISIIHDLAFKYFPEYIDDKHLKNLEKFLPRTIARSDAICVVSENTRQDLIKFYPKAKGKVFLTPLGIDHDVFRVINKGEALKTVAALGITKPFFLFHGTVEPRKNIESVVKAYNQLPDDIKDRYDLVVSGRTGWKATGVEELIKSSGENIHRVHGPDDTVLVSLMNTASLFIFPSHYEGYGLPIIEAMACGCPVITRSNSSLSEVGGKAVYSLPNGDANEIADAVQKLIDDTPTLKKMSAAGIKQAAKFTWSHTASALHNVLEHLSENYK